MTRFDPDFTQVSAGIKVFPRGEYELTVTGVKPILYFKKDKDGDLTDEEVAGCQVNIEMVGRLQNDGQLDSTDKGESVVPLRLYVHSEKAWGMTKGQVMAIMGYTREEEEAFNADSANSDYVVDGDPESDEDAELGASWQALVGQRFRATLDKRTYKGREQQEIGSLTPANVL